MNYENLRQFDPEIYSFIENETNRQHKNIELIASENFVSKAVLEACGTILTNKYAEGYPNARYYGGCVNVDMVEETARQRLVKLFGAEHANVQPHCGSAANFGVYFSILSPGDKILGMNLSHGGHLTHGSPVNMSGKYYQIVSYGVRKDTELIDYDEVREIALKEKPKLILAGASAYSREIDFAKFRSIADEVGAYFMVDMAHIAGIVAAGLHMSPIPYADFVTTTTHKTLRGPRGGAIMCKAQHAKLLDKAIFPGIQGGPLEHIIAAKAVCFKEALQPDFKVYQQNILDNAKALAKGLTDRNFRLVSGGTDNHLILIDLSSKNITGKAAEHMLDEIGITTNKNSIPFDTQSPMVTSGLRLGTPAVTSLGLGKDDMLELANVISDCLEQKDSLENLKNRVSKISSKQIHRD